jgi:hypothetical protein
MKETRPGTSAPWPGYLVAALSIAVLLALQRSCRERSERPMAAHPDVEPVADTGPMAATSYSMDDDPTATVIFPPPVHSPPADSAVYRGAPRMEHIDILTLQQEQTAYLKAAAAQEGDDANSPAISPEAVDAMARENRLAW